MENRFDILVSDLCNEIERLQKESEQWDKASVVELVNSNRELKERIAHLEALLVAVREEDAKVCEWEYLEARVNLPAEDQAYNTAISHCVKAIRSLPLPDARAEKIRKVIEAAIAAVKNYSLRCEDFSTAMDRLRDGVRDLEDK